MSTNPLYINSSNDQLYAKALGPMASTVASRVTYADKMNSYKFDLSANRLGNYEGEDGIYRGKKGDLYKPIKLPDRLSPLNFVRPTREAIHPSITKNMPEPARPPMGLAGLLRKPA